MRNKFKTQIHVMYAEFLEKGQIALLRNFERKSLLRNKLIQGKLLGNHKENKISEYIYLLSFDLLAFHYVYSKNLS